MTKFITSCVATLEQYKDVVEDTPKMKDCAMQICEMLNNGRCTSVTDMYYLILDASYHMHESRYSDPQFIKELTYLLSEYTSMINSQVSAEKCEYILISV